MDTLYLKTEELNEVDIDIESDNIVELKDNEFSAMENGSTNKKRLPSDPPVVNMSNYDSEDENLVILNMNNTKLNNSNSNINDKTNIISKKQTYHPIVIKISNIIIGRYDIGKLNKETSKLLINIVYQNVNKFILKKFNNKSNLNQINDIPIIIYNQNDDIVYIFDKKIVFNSHNNKYTKDYDIYKKKYIALEAEKELFLDRRIDQIWRHL